jgi:hypothetical protein
MWKAGDRKIFRRGEYRGTVQAKKAERKGRERVSK